MGEHSTQLQKKEIFFKSCFLIPSLFSSSPYFYPFQFVSRQREGQLTIRMIKSGLAGKFRCEEEDLKWVKGSSSMEQLWPFGNRGIRCKTHVLSLHADHLREMKHSIKSHSQDAFNEIDAVSFTSSQDMVTSLPSSSFSLSPSTTYLLFALPDLTQIR